MDKISIHAPREGGDLLDFHNITSQFVFQSTPPARGATAPLYHGHAALGISIHAPREGGRLRQRLCGAGGGGAEVAGSI